MSEQPDTSRAVRRGLLMVGVALAAILLSVLALSKTDIAAEEIELLWEGANGPLLITSLLMMTLAMPLLALRWRSLIPGGEKVGVLGLTGIFSAGLLLNYALPGPVGELAGAMLVQRRYGIPAEKALAGGVYARFLGLATAGAMAGIAWLFGDLPVPEEYEVLVGGAAGAIALGAAALGVLAFRPAWLRLISQNINGRLGSLLPGALGRAFTKLDDLVARFALAMGQVGTLGWKPYMMAVFWSMVAHLNVGCSIVLGAHALGLEPSIAGVVFTYCAATAAVVALFALPGGQLGFDAVFATFFTVTTGVDLPGALAMTLVVRVQQMIMLIMGAAALPLVERTTPPVSPGTSRPDPASRPPD